MQKKVSGFSFKCFKDASSASAELTAWSIVNFILFTFSLMVVVKASSLFLVIKRCVLPKSATIFFFFLLIIAFAAIVAESESATQTLLQSLLSGTLSKNITGISISFKRRKASIFIVSGEIQTNKPVILFCLHNFKLVISIVGSSPDCSIIKEYPFLLLSSSTEAIKEL